MNALYSTLRLFLLDVDNVFQQSTNKYAGIPLSVEIGRWAAALYTISTIIMLIFKYFKQSLKGNWYRFIGKHIIVFGYNKRSTILLSNLKKEGYNVILVSEKLSDDEKNDLLDKSIAFIENEFTNKMSFKKSGINRAKHVILIHEEDSVNLDSYIAIREYIDTQKRDKVLPISLHFNHGKTRHLYERIIRTESNLIKSYSFSLYQLVAEKMLESNPLYLNYGHQLRNADGGPLNILL